MNSETSDAAAEGFVQGRLRISARRPGYSGNVGSKLDPLTHTGSSMGGGSGSGTRAGMSINKKVRMTGSSSSTRFGTTMLHSFGATGETRGFDDGLENSGLQREEVKEAYERLRRLGMPSEITEEVFEQLVMGPSSSGRRQGVNEVGAAIVLLSKRLVGRQEARRVRGVIANAREQHALGTSKIKAPSAVGSGTIKGTSSSILDDPMKIACVKRDNAYRGLAGVRKEYEEVRQEMLALDAEKRKLEEEIQAKRRMALLMNVLKKRETARLARLGGNGGLGALLTDLSKTTGVVLKDHNNLVADLSSEYSKNTLHSDKTLLQRGAMMARRNAAWKYRHTTETLAKLHAIHIRRVRSAEMKEQNDSAGKDVDNRLDQLIDRLGIHVGHNEREIMKWKLIEAARRMVVRQNKLRWTIPEEERVDDIDLDEMHRSIEDKQRLVQQKVDRATAILWLCQEHVDSISAFRTKTASALRTMLDEERRRVDGYIDVIGDALKQTQEDQAKIQAKSESFAKEVRDIIGTGRESHAHILEDVKSMIEMVVLSDSLVNREEQKRSLEATWVGSGSEEKIKRLLERKGNKTDYGFQLAEEIKTLLADCKRLK